MWEKKRLPGSSGDAGTIRSKVKLPDLSIFPWLLAFLVVSPAVSSLNSTLKNLIIPLDITFASVSPYTLLSLLREIITFSMFFSFHFHIRTTEHKSSVIVLPTGAILNSWSLTSGGPFCCLAISITDGLPPISQWFYPPNSPSQPRLPILPRKQNPPERIPTSLVSYFCQSPIPVPAEPSSPVL